MIELTHGIQFSSLEEVDDHPHQWKTDFRALRPGQNHFSMQETLTPSVAIRTGVFSGPVVQRGEVPRGKRTYSFLLNEVEKHCFRSQLIDRSKLMVFGKNCEVDATSSSPASICTVTVDTTYLEHRSADWGADINIDSGGVTQLGKEVRLQLEVTINELARLQRMTGPLYPLEQLRLQENIVDILLDVLGTQTPEFINPKNGYRMVQKALNFMEGNIKRPIKLSEVTSELGISTRTLQLEFKKYLNASPKQAINQLRLASLRKSIRAGFHAHSSVSEFAFDHGYWHLSQLAQDYFQAFGELPSQTLLESKKIRIASTGSESSESQKT